MRRMVTAPKTCLRRRNKLQMPLDTMVLILHIPVGVTLNRDRIPHPVADRPYRETGSRDSIPIYSILNELRKPLQAGP